MKRVSLLFVLLILFSALVATLKQEVIGADSLNIGTVFELIFEAETDLLQAEIPDTLESFSIIKQDIIKTSGKKDRLKLSIMPLQLGALTFPELQIKGSEDSIYQSDRLRLHVVSVRAEADTLLRDIKAPKSYPYEPDFRILLALMLLALILLIILIIMFFKRKAAKQMDVPKVADVIPNWKRALAELANLLQSGLLEQGQYIEFHYALSMILRAYLEAEYGFNAREMTTFEIRIYLHSIAKEQIDATQQNEILLFLRSCDQVKYAKHEPSRQDVEQRIMWLQEYLKNGETRGKGDKENATLL